MLAVKTAQATLKPLDRVGSREGCLWLLISSA